MKRIGLAIAVAFALGCAAGQKKPDPWIGASQDQVLQKLGPPTAKEQLSTGGEVWQYKDTGTESEVVAQRTTWRKGEIPQYVQQTHSYCYTRLFIFSPEKTVTSWRYTGCN